MNKRLLCFVLLVVLFASCKKKDEIINNYGTQPAFVVNGINDITFTNDIDYEFVLNLTCQYMDSAQENVTLSLSGMPAGLTMDTTWISSGIPTFTTTLTVFDTSAEGISPGTYDLTLIATASSGVKKYYPFHMKVAPMPTAFLGKYSNCHNSCSGTSTVYADSLYQDPTVRNKVWFTNFANSGYSVYGTVSVSNTLTIPAQTVGGILYSGSAMINLTTHKVIMSYHINTTTCSFQMQ